MSGSRIPGWSEIRIESIGLRFGKGPGANPLAFDPGPMTLLVGPNNSGKSLTLQEIHLWLKGVPREPKIVKDVRMAYPSDKSLLKGIIGLFQEQLGENEVLPEGEVLVSHPFSGSVDRLDTVQRERVSLRSVERFFADRSANREADISLRRSFTGLLSLRLDSPSRFKLTEDQETGPRKGHLWYLHQNPDVTKQIRDVCSEAFPNLFFAIDASELNPIRIRMLDQQPDARYDYSTHPEAHMYLEKHPLIRDLGDGVKSFVGIMAAALSFNQRFLFIDDPDAFLSALAAKRLGRALTEVAHERGMQVFVSTHSPDFLVGCLDARRDTKVVRLTYVGGKATARLLDEKTLNWLLRSPLARSAGVMEAMFHKGTVVTEGEIDKLIYGELARRFYEASGTKRVFEDTAFVSAHAWNRGHQIIRPLREVGVPAAMILDYDTLLKNDTEWQSLGDACQLPSSVLSLRTGIAEQLRTLPQSEVRNQGKQVGGTPVSEVEGLISALGDYGIFVVECGRLESWFPDVVGNEQHEWLSNWFRVYGEYEGEASYRKPSGENYWKFLNGVAKWFDNPDRKGIP